jgi:hypothetical protein
MMLMRVNWDESWFRKDLERSDRDRIPDCASETGEPHENLPLTGVLAEIWTSQLPRSVTVAVKPTNMVKK